MNFSTNYNESWYAYLEKLRSTNPTAYYEWYQKYMAHQHAMQMSIGATNYSEDRASVHSGQSSCDEMYE